MNVTWLTKIGNENCNSHRKNKNNTYLIGKHPFFSEI